MARSFDYSDYGDRTEIISWLNGFSSDQWQEYIDFSFSDEHKKDFTFDERESLKICRGFLRSRDLSSRQFWRAAQAYSLIDRIESLRESDNTTATLEFDDNNAPLKHISLRVAWHDSMWNGHVCRDPERNIFCNGYHSLLSDRIRREKEKILPVEKQYAGRPITEMISKTGIFPPCYWSVNIFGSSSLPIYHKNPAANSLGNIVEELPPRSMFSWPFGFSFVRDYDEYKMDGKYPHGLEKLRVPWFRGKIKNERSVGIIYSKFSNPFSYEDMKYLIVGCGIIRDKSDPSWFGPGEKIEEIRKRGTYNKQSGKYEYPYRNFPEMNWAIRFTFDENTLVRIPYFEYDKYASDQKYDAEQREQLFNKIKLTVDEPELEHCFKYVAMDIDDDETIYILTKIRAKLIEVMSHAIVPEKELKKMVNKVELLIEHCYSERTHFPGFSAFSRALSGKNFKEEYKLDLLVSKLKENEPDYALKLKELIEDPKSDKEYNSFAPDLKILGDKIRHELHLETDEFLTLCMINLTSHQFTRISNGIYRKGNDLSLRDICKNPYELFEEYEPDEQDQKADTGEYIDFPVTLAKIDIALFPNTDFVSSNYLQEGWMITDERRIRALIIQHLRSLEFSTGDCFDDAPSITEKIKTYPLFFNSFSESYSLPGNFLENASETFDLHLSRKLHIHITGDERGKLYYLQELYQAEQEIGDFIKKLLGSNEPNLLAFDNQDYILDSQVKLKKKIGDSFDQEGFFEERKRLYQTLFPAKFYVLTGSPGSGKSYEILNIIKYFIEKKESYLLLAPTGKAVLRLMYDEDFRDVGITAMTIDKYINLRKNRKGQRQYNNIIIDEMSMVDLIKLRDLLDLFIADDPTLHRLILVGDPNQLPPIGFGKPFYDIIQNLKSNIDCHKNLIDLEVNCRQELEGNAIIDFSKLFSNEGDLTDEQLKKVKEGGPVSKGFVIRYWKDEDVLLNILSEELSGLTKEYRGSQEQKLNALLGMEHEIASREDFEADLERFQVITPYRVYSDKVNLFFQSIRKNEIDILKLFKPYDKIIRTKNFYIKGDLKLSNGSIGMAMKLKTGAFLSFPEYENKYFPMYGPEAIREGEKEFFELAYSITIHKAQGSGFDNLIVILPKRYGLLCRELFYTGLTRSKKTICILIEGEPGQDFEKSLFEYARKRTFTENRKTSLLMDNPYRYYGLEPEKDVFVQSRVEQIIYRHLLDFRESRSGKDRFEFEYEKFPELNGNQVRIKTDFTIYCHGKTWYWEHLGMLNKRSYKKQWLDYKRPTYEKAGIFDQVITTDELRGINDDKICEIIDLILNDKVEHKAGIYSNHHYSLR